MTIRSRIDRIGLRDRLDRFEAVGLAGEPARVRVAAVRLQHEPVGRRRRAASTRSRSSDFAMNCCSSTVSSRPCMNTSRRYVRASPPGRSSSGIVRMYGCAEPSIARIEAAHAAVRHPRGRAARQLVRRARCRSASVCSACRDRRAAASGAYSRSSYFSGRRTASR